MLTSHDLFTNAQSRLQDGIRDGIENWELLNYAKASFDIIKYIIWRLEV